MLVKWEGIVLRSVDYGEANKIITLYTREHGKVGLMARAAKKPKSRLVAVSQLFTHAYFIGKKGPGSGLADLFQGDIIHTFRSLREDLLITAYASYMAELLDRLSEDGAANPYLFQLLLLTFQYLDEGKDAEILCRIFESKMLTVAGIRPQLDRCVRCSREQQDYVFSISQGGLLCFSCKPSDPYALPISIGTAKLLRLFQLFDLQRLGEIEVKQSTRTQMRHILHQFMDEHIPLRLKSREVLEQIEKLY